MKRRMIGFGVLAMTILVTAVLTASAESKAPASQWYRGNTHMHSFWSDGNHFAEMAALWYKQNGYQFVVLTDHNNRPTKTGWANLHRHRANDPAGKLAKAFGHDHVVTKKDAKGNTLHRLLDYDAIAKLLNVPGKFAVVPGEELTDGVGYNPVHMNAINTVKTIGVKRLKTVLETAKGDAARARAHEKAHKRPVFVQLNHTNWRWDMTAEVLAETTDADAFEIVNPGCHNLGDKHSPSTERMWDIASTLRMKQYKVKPIWGVASDDTHNYHDFKKNASKANPGRAFVVVRANQLESNAITQSLKAGNFYSSTGVILKTVCFDSKARELTVEIDPADTGKSYTIEFIGTPKAVSIESKPAPVHKDIMKKRVKKNGKTVTVDNPVARKITRVYSAEIVKVLQTVKGKTRATFKLTDDLLYVRCKVTDTSHKGYTWRNETIPRAAWTQPVGWKPALAELREAAAKK